MVTLGAIMSHRDEGLQPDLEVRASVYAQVSEQEALAAPPASMPNRAPLKPSRGRPVLVLALITGVLLLAAAAPLEYGFYAVLRIAVTVVAIWIALASVRSRQVGWVVVAIIMAILFNSLIPVWLSKEIWVPIDVAGAVLVVLAGVFVRSKWAE